MRKGWDAPRERPVLDARGTNAVRVVGLEDPTLTDGGRCTIAMEQVEHVPFARARQRKPVSENGRRKHSVGVLDEGESSCRLGQNVLFIVLASEEDPAIAHSGPKCGFEQLRTLPEPRPVGLPECKDVFLASFRDHAAVDRGWLPEVGGRNAPESSTRVDPECAKTVISCLVHNAIGD